MNELLTFVMSALKSVPMNYMLTGSFALNFYTIPQATRDIDLVIELLPSQKDAFLNRSSDRFHLNERTLRQAVLAHLQRFDPAGYGWVRMEDV